MRFSNPIAVLTPAKPRQTPIALRGVIRSSARKMAAASTPKIAVAALRIEVSPEGMCSCPHAISEKGITLFKSPISRKAAQMRGSRGSGRRMVATAAQSTSIAQNTRCATEVSGPISSKATRTATKDAPQSRARQPISIQARGGMVFCVIMAWV